MLEIYTDWSCCWNWKEKNHWWIWIVIYKYSQEIYRHSENYVNTTNNKMELLAILRALSLDIIQEHDWEIILYSDSNYAIRSSDTWKDGWVAGWKRNGKLEWKIVNWEQLKNLLYIQEINRLIEGIEVNGTRKIKFQWVKGHNGNEGNEIADVLSNRRDNGKVSEFEG